MRTQAVYHWQRSHKLDGGRQTAPQGRLFGPDGTWFPEGLGVAPDIAVVDDPSQMARGHDPQREAAISTVLELLEQQQQPVFPEPPPFEDRTTGWDCSAEP